MSWHASTWASEFSESRLAARLVMLIIAHHVSNDEGEAHPSIETICRETRLGRSSVIAALQQLSKMGELAVRRGGKFRGDSNSYTLPKFSIWVQTLNPKGKLKGPVRVQNEGQKGSKVALHRIIESLDVIGQSRAQSRSARNITDDEIEKLRKIEAREKRKTDEARLRSELNIGKGPSDD